MRDLVQYLFINNSNYLNTLRGNWLLTVTLYIKYKYY